MPNDVMRAGEGPGAEVAAIVHDLDAILRRIDDLHLPSQIGARLDQVINDLKALNLH